MRISWTYILFFSCTTSLYSQAHPKTVELIDTASLAICKCFNTTFDSLDNEIRDLIKEVLIAPDSGQQKIQNYLQQAGEERATEVKSQLLRMGSIDSELTACLTAATQIFQNITCEIEKLSEDDQLIVESDFESEEKTIDLLLNSLGAHNECQFAYRFIKLGLELEKK